MTRIGRFAAAATAAGAVMTLAAAPPVSQADNQFITVTLPANADLTTYGWCDTLRCQQPLRLTRPDPAAVYTAITAVPLKDDSRTAGLDSYALGAWATTQAVRRLQSTPPPPGSTVVASVLLRTPTRPNGGLLTRFMPDAATPPSNFNAFVSGGPGPPGQPVDTSFVDVAREYDGIADFPSWPNPFSVANALAGAVFLSNYNDTVTWRNRLCPGGTCTAPATWPVVLPKTTGNVYATALVPNPVDPTKNIFVTSPFPVGVAVIPTIGDQTVYYTEFTGQLPLLTPLQVPFDLINNVISAASQGNVQVHLTNPLVQALQPALAILVNLGYTDVNPAAGYSRTLLRPGEQVPFGTLPNLTPAQWLGVPGAVSLALVAGVLDAVLNPFGVFNGPSGWSSTTPVRTNSPAEQRNPGSSPGPGLSDPQGSSPVTASSVPNSSAPPVTLGVTTATTRTPDVTGGVLSDAGGRAQTPHSPSHRTNADAKGVERTEKPMTVAVPNTASEVNTALSDAATRISTAARQASSGQIGSGKPR